ncbi:MAG: PilT/PilU family type 4a pilus ATPase [Pyrinomonadaceae bacterium]
MEKLNEYLQTLLSSCSDELHLEPERNPYLVSENRTTELGNVPMLGTQISMMVFPLIPSDVKSALPHSSEVEFVHPHNLGNFNFVVQKSPAGFNVTIRPMLGDSSESVRVNPPLPERPPAFQAELGTPISALEPVAEPTPAAGEYVFESASAGVEYNAGIAAPSALDDLLVDHTEMASEYIPSNESPVEIVSANDPSFQTIFSDTSTYEPPGRRDDLGDSPYITPTKAFVPVPVIETAQPAFETPMNEYSQPQEAYVPLQNYVPPVSAAPALPAEPTQAGFVPAAANAPMRAKMDSLFQQMSDIGASDLHLSVSMSPMIRKDGKMKPLQEGEQALTSDAMRTLLTSIMPPKNQEEFSMRNDTDFAYEIPNLARFRCNVFMDRKGMGAVFRIIPTKILTAEQLGLSKAIMDLCSLSKGLVVVTGPTGSGKSTTLCAMVDSINKNREDHIITIEDPIEFTHENQKCLVNQREVHNHTDSFKDALRAALREDPDILLVGEMRDLETISIAIETAETGHLVFGTLHTTTAASTVDRIIDQFPADRQQQIRVMLSESLKGVIAQTLLPKKGGGRVAALEVLIVTPAISNLIREGKTFQIPSAMQTGKTHGMVMLNDALYAHVESGMVEPRDAYVKAVDKAGFEMLLTRGGFSL